MTMRWRLVILLVIMVLPFVGFSVFKAYDINRSRLAWPTR
jgi:type II secretory pathway component PulL